ncbi:MAG: RHS repeat-associated core domain-containing protein [Saprospiraceae bacterium]
MLNKLQKTVKTGASTNSIQHYMGGIEYNSASGTNRRVEAIYHSEGRFFNTNTGTTTPTYRTEYTIKDHLGNARVSFADLDANGKIDLTNSTSTNEIIQENHYYAFGMAHEGPWLMNNGSAKDNFYQYNSKEYNNDHALNWNDYGARWYDPAIGRFTGVDPLAHEFPSWTPYHYVHGNPVRLSDPTGMQADTTRIYNPEGEYKFTIDDNLPNEDHFLLIDEINIDLNGQCCNDPNQEGEYARSISEFYIGAETRAQLKEITALSNSLNKEQGFVLTVGSGRQLNVTNISNFADVKSRQIQGMNFAIEKSGIKGIVGVGHTHPNAKNESPAPFPSDPVYGKMSDYSPHMYNPYNKNIYGGYLSIVSARNGFSIYQNGSVPNSYTFNPKTYSTVPAISQSFRGKRF